MPLHVEINGNNYEAEYERLRAVGRVNAIILPVADWEARRLAGDIQNVLNVAGWNAEIREPHRSVIDGVAVYSGHINDKTPEPAGEAVLNLVNTIFAALGSPSGVPSVIHQPLDVAAGAAYEVRDAAPVIITVGPSPIEANLMAMDTEDAIRARKAKP